MLFWIYTKNKKMKALVISDTHNNLMNLENIFKNELDADFLIHCGDVNDPETLQYLIANFSKPIYLALGNCDQALWYWWQKQTDKPSHLNVFKEWGEVEISNRRFAFSHYREQVEHIRQQYDAVFYGHSHQPFIDDLQGGHWLLNPGNAAGLYYPATYATWDLSKNFFKLNLLNNLK
jgi:hypothetical protein